MKKRAAIFEDKADDDLTAKVKAVYKYLSDTVYLVLVHTIL
jgi:hypothetical protein